MSKGSHPRPIPDKRKFESNWDMIFSKPAVQKAGKPSDTPPKSVAK